MTLAPLDGSYDFQYAFEKAYKDEFGFLLEDKVAVVDDVRVRGIGRSFDDLPRSPFEEVRSTEFRPLGLSTNVEAMNSIYFESTGRVDVPVFRLDKLETGYYIAGPAAILDGTQTLIVNPRAVAKICEKHVFIELDY
jgi:5-oxoprolinase (ATP-hydrolysing)